jgi:hypothetical protein
MTDLPTPADFAQTLIGMARSLNADNPYESARQAIRTSIDVDVVDGRMDSTRRAFYEGTLAAIDQGATDDTYAAVVAERKAREARWIDAAASRLTDPKANPFNQALTEAFATDRDFDCCVDDGLNAEGHAL